MGEIRNKGWLKIPVKSSMPIKRFSTVEEQTKAILFLASDDASYINGVSLDVNGGLYMA